MKVSEIHKLVTFQLQSIFMVDSQEADLLDEETIRIAVSNTQRCLVGSGNKYYIKQDSINGESGISLYNSVMYCILLYWLSRELFQNGKLELADKVYYLNKMPNAVELFYEVKLPAIWSCEHPLGSVMGRADYGDYFFFYQGCTVGGNFRRNGKIVYPTIGHHVKMFSNSKILGGSHIGNHVIISANSYIKDQDVPDDTIVFGQSPNLVFKENFLKIRK